MKRRWIVFIGKNLIRILLLTICISMVTFALMKASPIDPLQANVGQAALGTMSQEQREKLEEYWGVNTPPIRQYLSWAGDFVRGDMGISLLYRQPVTEVIAVKLSNSLFLMITAWIISGVLGFLLGVVSGMNQGKFVDKLIRGYCLVVSSTPAFWLALLLLMIFSVWLQLFPIGLSVPIGVEASGVTFLDRVYHAVLPALTLSITGVSNIALHTREKMIDVMQSDYVLFARMRGEKGWRLFRYYGFRNVLLPAVTLHFASISEIFGGSVLVEQVFSYPGLGQAAVAAGLGSDLPLLMAITIVSALIVFGGNLAANLLYGMIDPRIRRGGAAISCCRSGGSLFMAGSSGGVCAGGSFPCGQLPGCHRHCCGQYAARYVRR